MQNALNKLRYGLYDEEVATFLNDLQQNIEEENENYIHLFTTNKRKDMHNSLMLQICRGATKIFSSADWVKEKNEYYDRRMKTEFRFPEKMELKVGCQVMLLRNMTTELVNGSVGIVENLSPLEVRFSGISTRVERLTEELFELVWSDKYGRMIKIKFATRKQYPLVLAYALTINKAQGLTLERLVVNADNIV
jgi:hypothetical protein